MTPVTPAPGSTIAMWAIMIGLPLFAVGFVGPILFSSSNAGPLLGILVTGPVGVLLGSVLGAVVWMRGTPQPDVAALSWWLGGIWLATLTYTLWAFALTARIALPGIAAQGFVAGACAFILYSPTLRTRLPKIARACGPIVLAVIVLVIAVNLFPPVMRPWWGQDAVASEGPVSLPIVAFVLHPGFDAGRHVPLFAVNWRVLLVEWIVLVAFGAALCSRVARRE